MVLPVNTKSLSGTATNVAISPPDARLQSVQWQFAMKVGSASNPYVTAPQAQWPVYFLLISFFLQKLTVAPIVTLLERSIMFDHLGVTPAVLGNPMVIHGGGVAAQVPILAVRAKPE